MLKVWLYLLLTADAGGCVRSVPPAIAMACGLPLPRVREILSELSEPDPDSRTTADEGRRMRIHRETEYQIELVNFRRYAALTYGSAERQRRYRQRKRDVTRDAGDVTRDAGDVTRDAGDVTRDVIRMKNNNLSASEDAVADSRSGQGRKRPDPDVKHLVSHYAHEYERIHGAKPVVTGATAKAAQALLTGRGLNDAKRLVTTFLEDPPAWYRDRGLYDLRHILAGANVVLARGEDL